MDSAMIKERLGGFNDFPPNYETITQSHFLWLWAVKSASRERVYRQAYEKGSNDYHELNFWVFPDFSGVGWETKYDGRAIRSEIDAYTCLYFKFKWCEHSFDVRNQRNCYREYHCTKCGYVEIVDSSG